MPFLTKDELITVADTNLIDKITNTNDDIVSDIINQSISLMTTYLKPKYDTDVIFSATGTARNLTIVKFLKDIAIYEIYIRHSRSLNEVAAARYKKAMRWLEKVNTGEFSADLPTPDTITDTNITISYNSNSKYTNKF